MEGHPVMEREHTRVHEENKTEAGKVWWVQPDGLDDVGGPVGQCGWSGQTMWVVWSDDVGGPVGRRWGWLDEDGDEP